MQTERHWDTKNHTAKNRVQSLHSKQQLEKANQIFETISAHTESKNKFLDLLTKNFLWTVLPKKYSIIMVDEEHLVVTKRVVASLPISSCNLHEKYDYKHHLFNVNGSSSSTSSVSRSCQGCTSDLIMLKSQLVKRDSGRFSTP